MHAEQRHHRTSRSIRSAVEEDLDALLGTPTASSAGIATDMQRPAASGGSCGLHAQFHMAVPLRKWLKIIVKDVARHMSRRYPAQPQAKVPGRMRGEKRHYVYCLLLRR